MFELMAALFFVAAVGFSLRAKVLSARARAKIRELNNMLDVELGNVKFGPEGEESRRETAERIGRLR